MPHRDGGASHREAGASQSKRSHSKTERTSSPKRPRSDKKSVTENERSSNHDKLAQNAADLRQRKRSGVQEKILLENEATQKMEVNGSKETGKKRDQVLADNKHRGSNDTMRARSYYQHDERTSGQRGQSFGRGRAGELRYWGDSKDRSDGRARDKGGLIDTHSREMKTSTQADDRGLWRHDGFYELEKAPSASSRRRPSFTEQKRPREQGNDVDNMEERSHTLHSVDQVEVVENSNHRTDDRPLHARDKESFISSNERFVRGFQKRHRFIEQGQTWRGPAQVEKWKHDMFEEANRSPTPGKDDDQIAKLEALLAS